MSYDLQIWSTQPVGLPEQLPEADKWRLVGDLWTREGRNWHLSVGPSEQVLAEDVPEEVEKHLIGLSFLTELNLSPVTAPAGAKKLMSRIASTLAKAARGVVFDPQTDTVTTAKGVSRLESLGPSDSASVLALSWWFTSTPLVDRDVRPLIDVLEPSLPEALPRRYGHHEPPQHKYESTGRDHFISFFREGGGAAGLVVWYPHSPVAHVALSIPPRVGGSRMGFRCGQLTITLDEDALAQPGWAVGIQRAWRRISRAIRPFYGDVRTFGGYTRKMGRYWSGRETEHHPVCSWFWAGLPAGPARAVVLGDPYRKLWPAFRERGDSVDELSFLSVSDWRTGEDALQALGPPPSDVAQVTPESGSPDAQRRYPAVWPFSPPRMEE